MTFRISPVRSLKLFGEVKEALNPAEAKLYELSRRAGKHTFGSRPFEFLRGKKHRLPARKTHWKNLQAALQRVAKVSGV